MTMGPADNPNCTNDLCAQSLQDAILAAHAKDDAGRLAALYERAADLSEARGDTKEACFFLTQALVFAMVSGSPQQAQIRRRLHAHGREQL